MLTFLTGLKNDMFWSETGSGFREPGRLSHKLPINSKKLPLIAFKSCLKVAFFLKLPKSLMFKQKISSRVVCVNSKHLWSPHSSINQLN